MKVLLESEATAASRRSLEPRGDDDRITAFGKHLDPKASAGESIGVELIAARAVSSIVDALGALVTSGTTDLYYEDVYDRLLRTQPASLDMRAMLVGDLPWTEVDTAEDLARAGEIANRTRLS